MEPSKISAELLFDHQHGPIITVHCAGKLISVYLMHETGTVTDEADNTGYGIEVKGDWWKLRQMFEPPMMPLADEVVDAKVVLELRKEIERLQKTINAKEGAIKTLQLERDDREMYWRDWNGRAANRVALLEGEIKRLKQEQEKLVALATPILAQFKRSKSFLDLATSDVRDLLKAICDKD